MGLFGFGKEKKSLPEIRDMVWINNPSKQKGVLNFLQKTQNAILVAWFTETQEQFDWFLNGQNNLGVTIELARTIYAGKAEGKKLILLEHYPLRSKEEDLISKLQPAGVVVFNSLEEPLFAHFGGDRLTQMISSLGLKEDEMIEHPMISKSIEQAQQKLEKEIIVEHTTNSQKEWMEKNIHK